MGSANLAGPMPPLRPLIPSGPLPPSIPDFLSPIWKKPFKAANHSSTDIATRRCLYCWNRAFGGKTTGTEVTRIYWIRSRAIRRWRGSTGRLLRSTKKHSLPCGFLRAFRACYPWRRCWISTANNYASGQDASWSPADQRQNPLGKIWWESARIHRGILSSHYSPRIMAGWHLIMTRCHE